MPNATPPKPGMSPDGLPVIIVNVRELRDVSDEVVRALSKANCPPVLFMRSSSIVRVCRDEKGRPFIDDVDIDEMVSRMTRVANYRRRSTNRTYTVFPPRDVARDVLVQPSLPFPQLEAITEVPVLRPDGSVLVEPGYDPATRLLYVPAPELRVPPIPDRPTATDVEAAQRLILDAIEEFPFVDEASHAAAWAMLLTPVMRAAINGPTPLALMDAPAQGTGKTLLVKVVSLVATGREPAVMTSADDEEEWRKRITATLREGPAIVLIDNVEKPLRSAHLAGALTTGEWTDRILRFSKVVKLPQRASWFATGNNISVGGDMQRRVYYCRMDARLERPWEREGFKRPDLPAWASEHRGELVAALLTLARAWFVAERPEPAEGTPALGGFEGWRHAIGGTLHSAGIVGFLGNRETIYREVDADGAEWSRFLAAWHRNYGSEPASLATITQSFEMTESLPSWLDPNDRGFRRKLGWALRKNADRRFDGYWIERAGASKEGALWRVASERPPADEAEHSQAAPNLRLVCSGTESPL
jgi:hypothetical protein